MNKFSTLVIIQLNQNIIITKTTGAAIEEFVGLKPKMYSCLVNDCSEHKKTKGENRNAIATISHYE